MDPRTKSSLLWGLVGALAFLVLAQGWILLGGSLVGPVATFGVSLAVFAAAATAAHVARPHLR
jgi:uncharacterized membrane protein YhhN